MNTSEPSAALASPGWTSPGAPVLLFYDGECNFCNRWVSYIVDRDPTHRTRFGAKSGTTFAAIARAHPEVAAVDSIVVVRRRADGTEEFLAKSPAVRAAIDGLPGFTGFATLLRLIPKPLSDFGYSIVSRIRGYLPGLADHCRVRTSRPAELFVD